MNASSNPFRSPQEDGDARYAPNSDPGVDQEPHVLHDEFPLDGIHQATPLHAASTRDEAMDHSVWDEPGVSFELSGSPPDGALMYCDWLTQKISTTSRQTSWNVTAVAAIMSGCLAFAASRLLRLHHLGGLVGLILFEPVAQEVLKIAVCLWIVERRPYYFKSAGQILLVAVASSLMFAVLENVFFSLTGSGRQWLDMYRWTVGAVMHVACGSVAGLGLVQTWRDCLDHRHRPQLAVGATFLVGAILLHGLFNAFMVLATLSGLL